jgi:hypothetical protein
MNALGLRSPPDQGPGRLCQKPFQERGSIPVVVVHDRGSVGEPRGSIRPALAFLMPFLFFEVATWGIRQGGPEMAFWRHLLFSREAWEILPVRQAAEARCGSQNRSPKAGREMRARHPCLPLRDNRKQIELLRLLQIQIPRVQQPARIHVPHG